MFAGANPADTVAITQMVSTMVLTTFVIDPAQLSLVQSTEVWSMGLMAWSLDYGVDGY